MIAKLERTQSNAQQNKNKHRTPNGKHTKQQINNNITTALERTVALATGGLDVFYCAKFALDSVASETSFKWRIAGKLMMAQHYMPALQFCAFLGIRTSIANKPYISVIFQCVCVGGGGRRMSGPPVPPVLPHGRLI